MPAVRQARAGKHQGLRLLGLAGGMPFYPVEGRLEARRRTVAYRKAGAAGAGKGHGGGFYGHHRSDRREADFYAQGRGGSQHFFSNYLSKELKKKSKEKSEQENITKIMSKEEIDNTIFEGKSSFVSVEMKGNKELTKVKILAFW